MEKLVDWLNRNIGVTVGIGLSALVAIGLALAYSQGKIETGLTNVNETAKAQTHELKAFRIEVNQRFDRIDIALDTEQTDLKQILVATGAVAEADVFYAAVRDNSIWVFPGDPLLVDKLTAKGLALEQFTPLIEGYRVLPSSVIDFKGKTVR